MPSDRQGQGRPRDPRSRSASRGRRSSRWSTLRATERVVKAAGATSRWSYPLHGASFSRPRCYRLEEEAPARGPRSSGPYARAAAARPERQPPCPTGSRASSPLDFDPTITQRTHLQASKSLQIRHLLFLTSYRRTDVAISPPAASRSNSHRAQVLGDARASSPSLPPPSRSADGRCHDGAQDAEL
jgi:hypothetical protein